MRKACESNISTKAKKLANKKQTKKNRVFPIIAVVFLAYFAYTVYDQQLQINKYDSQIEMYQSDISSKNELKEYYTNQKSNIKSDEYIENVAREDLGYVKPHEKVFVDANK